MKSETPPEKHTGTLKEDTSENKDELVEISREEQCRRETETLFNRLQLGDKRQQTLTPADFLQIGPALKQQSDTPEKDLVHMFLQRLMILDYRARYIPVKQDSAEVCQFRHELDNANDETGKSILDALFSSDEESNPTPKTNVHPMDVQMAVFHCSDTFLRQNMITKLSQCQYALPLLVPDPVSKDIECPLWTFRQIRKSWKMTDKSKGSIMKSMPVCKAETPMVSFLRLGSASLSKSQLLNNLINERHSTFFHRNCPGSTKTRYLMDGVAEIAWYCPAGKHNDSFTDFIAFCNLHGDALSFDKQRDILIEKASINVVLLPSLKRGDRSMTVISSLLKSSKPLICLVADNDCNPVLLKAGHYKMGLKDKSQSDASEELKGIIRNILSGSFDSFQLETLAQVSGIRVDEENEICKEGKAAALKITSLLQDMDVSKIKEKMLPCQGELWHEWSRITKQQYHLKGAIEMEKSKNQEKLQKIRQRQSAASCSDLMQLFINNLSSLPSNEKACFLKWTRILLDDLSTDDLARILHCYDKKWSEVLALKKNKSDKLQSKQTELEEISTQLQAATFGLEHIFREMGQIYEANESLARGRNTGRMKWCDYPALAAELMISGHPMELMDGDAGHVPLTWISSLLDEVIKKLGDKRVFVLSVLGVQSSGKSTMLNAMFGLQFAVSAGRCTKGAFMQLVKVSEEMKNDLKYDYVLVVDTEGLRALELAGNTTLHHDNELATFVIGVGNMTLINIFGENPAEMQDVLQIVVQAIMRMKNVKLSPSCVFVHQNVTDIAASEKNMDGKRRLQEKLDQMAQLAAKEEGCDAKSFSDIIEFDVQEDVKYFAQLWEGSPPMAPPNPGYSESVQELKNTILSKASQSDGMTLSQFKHNIGYLWNALLNENFVFSFKNTLEIAVYRKLEVQYGNWTWTLRKELLTIENQLHNRIENGNHDMVELSYLYKEMSKTYEDVRKAMATYFDDNQHKEMLAQWRGRFESKIKDIHEELVKALKRKLDEVLQQKNACKKLDKKKPEFEKKLLQKSKELALQLKDKATNERELQKQFNHVWDGWVTELTADTEPIKDINLQEDQLSILLELGIESSLIHERQNCGKYKNIANLGDYSEYVTRTKHQDPSEERRRSEDERVSTNTTTGQSDSMWTYFWKKITSSFTKQKRENEPQICFQEQDQIRTVIDKAYNQAESIIQHKPLAKRGYSSTYVQEMAKNVSEQVKEFGSQQSYALKKKFTVDLLLYVFDAASKRLLESHNQFKRNNDLRFYVNSKKEQFYGIFSSVCKGHSSAVVFAEMICDKLKDSTVQAVYDKTAIDLAGEMKCSFSPFNGNRMNLEKHVLKSLAEKEDFQDYMNYIRHPREHVKTFIKEEVKKYIFTEHKDSTKSLLKKNVQDIQGLLSRALHQATEKVAQGEANINMWLEGFSSELKDQLKLDTICCQNFSDVNNFDFLKEEVAKRLESMVKEITALPLGNLEKSRVRPDEILIDQLCNCCWVQCPFCKAICTNTLGGHSPDKHSVPFHRSSGINGWHFKDTVELDIDFCTTSVASDGSFYPQHDSDKTIPFKLYHTAGPEFASWKITADESKLIYWKWFVCKFQKELENDYKMEFKGRGEIPNEWRKHTKQEAIASLDQMYKS
ncbi:interferon-induced very large GTPase 1-like [Genypterus blacodes]|uniref:interferon-induced very large GTPase 1-like n=1 Tax=Genypterus blacodes TaxID=154954 RepID=UPI003F7730F4